MTPELLETGAECVASNSLGRNTTIIFLELGKGWVLLQRGRGQAHVGLIPLPPLTPIHFMSSTPDSNRTTNLSTSTISPPARANSTSTGELGWTGHPHSALPSPGEPWAVAHLPSALDWAGQ